ncbi:hypothetical protein EJF36_12470 [Bacillus sp. HMF5848]|uniref:hypothetical protein n=1 Tax=Bacillus sp. HMF5848 TaxID=2495421 RepID=UPI000F7A4D58|nr:hypothetical protein [Bacillus sp. HMF5848]RSK27624.1 hypothetical protein EJF36_12470 [Bacillus sp. HMF5848]
MGTTTAQILIGQAHPYEGGIMPDYSMQLIENSVPKWILTPHGVKTPTAIWIPTIEHMLEDALIMIGLFVLKDEELLRIANQFKQIKDLNKISMYEDIPEKGCELMRERVRQIDRNYKVALSVYNGSSIARQVDVLSNYQMDVEVCMPIFVREYSVWTNTHEAKGSLDHIERLK